MPFEHFTADGLPIDTTVTPGRIKKFVDVDDVTITFIDAVGLRWRITVRFIPATAPYFVHMLPSPDDTTTST